ncbi:aryldialkylphosphatase [Microbacterium laevaniformans OR221]|nr:aryldialkylphosphatase [Microbacterium laevaniformans OR221]
MGKIRTVLGDIEPEKLGFTYPHEHLWCSPPASQPDRDLELTSYEASLYELKLFKSVGGGTIVDGSPLDYGRDGRMLKQLAIDSDVNVLGLTGFNKHVYYPDWVGVVPIEFLVERMVKDITVGMDGSDAKAGLIKGGSWYNLVHPLERKTTIALARASLETGAPIWLHTEAGTMGMEMLDIIEGEGVDLETVVVGHSDRNADPRYHLQMLERGAYIEFDGPGKVKYYPDSVRVDLVRNVIDHGFADKLVISGDMGRKSYLEGYGGGPGFRFIKQVFVPRLIEEGIPEDVIHKIFHDNPAAWLGKF